MMKSVDEIGINALLQSISLLSLVWIIFLLFIGRAFLRWTVSLLRNPKFVRLLVLVFLVLASGARVYHLLEGWSHMDSLYFTVITLTTVGFGDLVPTTPVSKIFTLLYLLLGLGIIGAFIATLTEHSKQWMAENRRLLAARHPNGDGDTPKPAFQETDGDDAPERG